MPTLFCYYYTDYLSCSGSNTSWPISHTKFEALWECKPLLPRQLLQVKILLRNTHIWIMVGSSLKSKIACWYWDIQPFQEISLKFVDKFLSYKQNWYSCLYPINKKLSWCWQPAFPRYRPFPLKIANFSYPPCIYSPRWRGSPWNLVSA